MLDMHSLFANALVRNVFTWRAETMLIGSLERHSKEVTIYIDIKSEGLRDILRVVLHDIKAISLMEDKPSVPKKQEYHL
jgi:hypothetical protein